MVISPLIALMKDQVDALVARGVRAANLDSTQDADRAAWIKSEVLSGNMKILYVAPERSVIQAPSIPSWTPTTSTLRLNNEGFMAMMKRVRLSLLAVDESHCISQVRIYTVYLYVAPVTMALHSGGRASVRNTSR